MATPRSLSSASRIVARLLFALLLCTAVVSVNTTPVAAANASTRIQAACSTTAYGDAWTNWDGGTAFDDAQTSAWLYRNDGGTWIVAATGYGEDMGYSGLAIAPVSAQAWGTTWYMVSQHRASFHIPNPNLSTPQFYC